MVEFHALFEDTNQRCLAIGFLYNRAANFATGYKDWYFASNTSLYSPWQMSYL